MIIFITTNLLLMLLLCINHYDINKTKNKFNELFIYLFMFLSFILAFNNEITLLMVACLVSVFFLLKIDKQIKYNYILSEIGILFLFLLLVSFCIMLNILPILFVISLYLLTVILLLLFLDLSTLCCKDFENEEAYLISLLLVTLISINIIGTMLIFGYMFITSKSLKFNLKSNL